MCKNQITEPMYNELLDYINSFEHQEGILISVLHKAQSIFGYLPREVQEFVANHLKIHLAEVYGVVSFYSYFTMVPKGEVTISICLGTACYVRGADKILNVLKQELGVDVGETTSDGKYTLDVLRCVGACGLAPVVLVDDAVHGRITTRQQVREILAKMEV